MVFLFILNLFFTNIECLMIFFPMTNGLLLLHIIVADMRKVLAKNSQVEQQRLHRRVFLDNVNLENQALMVCMNWFDLPLFYLVLQLMTLY
jgi:hypothetical protein